MNRSNAITEFNLFWKLHAERQGDILDALGEVWVDTPDQFIGYDGQEGVFHFSNKTVFATNGVSSVSERKLNFDDFVYWPLEKVVEFFKSVKPNI